MLALLHDLYGHQAWADAELWKAIGSVPPALDDPAIRKRLHHIHFTQRAFLGIARREEYNPALFKTFDSIEGLRDYARHYHHEAIAFLAGVEESTLSEQAPIPWFRDPPLKITIGEALTQAAMHSHYHRAQNASRLRELGGEPPMTDLIVWYWKGRPEASWQ